MASSSNDEDPFLQVQQDVLSQISGTRALFSSYIRIRSLASSSSPELASAQADLEAALESLAEDLADLVASVQAVESDPARFGLSNHELSRRKRLVADVGAEVSAMRDELHKKIPSADPSATTTTTTAVHAASELPDPSAFAIPDGSGDAFGEFEAQQQVEMMQQQDRHLDGVFRTVGNLRRQADDMGRELEEQAGMLEVVDDAVERVGTRLQTGMAKMRHVMRKNEDTLSSCCIGVLIFVLIFLLVLLLIL
ncbi:t-SNARE affecting a late Golgi compartment protein 1 [Escovopsis weberi]|uniref:t-SNARE affecting a late Golgi compartment protein 1 n=1 Tax=Escovopsis weberi TaxID=150374 RepID=A0A0M9VTL4_ESCWE|nr:t-SNARE affecting a late Golgi compartment protein 1 [Escovopsis weberi]